MLRCCYCVLDLIVIYQKYIFLIKKSTMVELFTAVFVLSDIKCFLAKFVFKTLV
jgi:hypothetical protein